MPSSSETFFLEIDDCFGAHQAARQMSVISIFDGANAEVFEVPRPIR
jgi:hypothetical protein